MRTTTWAALVLIVYVVGAWAARNPQVFFWGLLILIVLAIFADQIEDWVDDDF